MAPFGIARKRASHTVGPGVMDDAFNQGPLLRRIQSILGPTTEESARDRPNEGGRGVFFPLFRFQWTMHSFEMQGTDRPIRVWDERNIKGRYCVLRSRKGRNWVAKGWNDLSPCARTSSSNKYGAGRRSWKGASSSVTACCFHPSPPPLPPPPCRPVFSSRVDYSFFFQSFQIVVEK